MKTIEFDKGLGTNLDALRAFAYTLTDNFEDANDLFQETLYKALKYKHQYQEGTNLKAWLSTIMRNTYINNYRRKRRNPIFYDGTVSGFWVNSGGATVYNTGESDVMMKELTATIDEMEDGLRIPFLMYYEGFKYGEIAEQMDLPLGTVKSRIHFARKYLKQQINTRYEFDSIGELAA